jgi:hypothetical protein
MPSEALEAERRLRYYAKASSTASIAAAKSRRKLRSYAKVLRAASIVALNDGHGLRSYVKACRIASVIVSKMRRKLRSQMEISCAASIKASNIRRTLVSNPKDSRTASILPADEMATETTSRYLYRPLNKDRKEIRLLTLEPGQGDQIIRCTLSHTFLDECPIAHYETISYTCGDPALRSKIMLHGNATDVLASSEVVLRRMRLPAAQRVLWVDSICIDQENTAERGHQVGMMYEIYANTSMNLIWLGPDDGYTEQAAMSVRAIMDEMAEECNGLENLGSILRNEKGTEQFSNTRLSLANLDKTCESLEHLYGSPWFGRLWVVQEVSLAPISACYRGAYEIPILDVLRAVSFLSYKWYHISEYVTSGSENFVHAATIFDLTDREHGYYRRFFKRTTFLSLLDDLRSFGTIDPRDHVFGTLGLWRQQSTSAEQSNLLNPDYSLEICDVFQNAARYAVREAKSLRLLLSCLKSEQDFGKWPSWVPRWDHQFVLDTDSGYLRASFRSDNDVGMTLIESVDEPSLLCVSGLVIDVIAKVLPAFNTRTRAHKWQKRLAKIEALPCNNTWIKNPLGSIEAKFASTLSAGGAVLGNVIDDTESLGCYRAYKQHLTTYQQWPSRRIKIDHPATDEERQADNFDSFSAVAMNRAVFNSEDGHIGLGPRNAKTGDLLVILYGSQYPAVLRPHHEDENYFFFVGPAYVYGIMDGEAVREYKARGVKDTFFVIA